jgi:glycosyltransferase involved in cell wall biosynthesis/peptidoglycan/xylan/chitin deacetylase (PgdA/CDA1 family)
MLINNIYYLLKPILPWRLRTALRRWRAERRRRTFADVWPIDPKAAVDPCGWPGWPDGKRFAVVLTHDVEGNKGLERVEQLMELERKYGFRSSFNFVPEREYRVSSDLRQKLEAAGFEVGVHGLKHDGKLYSSKANFAARAARIRQYSREWNAAGFRSPLMQHKLGWLHELGTEYDASTFDTDPFEPEPDGMGTIFPFWVPGGNGTGFVELPYTVVQDFSLFVVLREQNIEIWKQKVDWIVEHGGMVLINTHPDYMQFDGSKKELNEYPVELYQQFLSYLREKYEGTFWTATPREVARYYRETIPPPSRNTRRKICMVAYTYYESDNRLRRYAEALAKRGDQVDIIALDGTYSLQREKHVDGITVYRVQKRDFNERSKWSYAVRLLRFLVRSSIALMGLHRRNRYDVIHIHNMPDFLVFAAWYPKLTGAKLILDIHDVVPEFFSNKFNSELNSPHVRALKFLERLSASFVDHVIVSNHLWQQRLIERSVSREKCSVFLNSADPGIFSPHSRTRNDGRYIVLFPGSFQWHQGLDIAIRAFAEFKRQVPNAEFHLYGGGNSRLESELKELVCQLNLSDSVKFCGGISLDKIPSVIANSDMGVVPKRADSFGNEAYSTKIMEFMSQGVPVVASRTKIDSYYFEEGVIHFFPSGNSSAMAQAMLDVVRNPQLRESLVARGYEYVSRHGWQQKRNDYLDLIDVLSTERFNDVQIAPGPVSTVELCGEVLEEIHGKQAR